MKTNEEIQLLTVMVERAELDHSLKLSEYRKRLLAQWTKVFDNDRQLHKDAENAQNASEYGTDEHGIYSWFRVKTNLDDYAECKEYLEEYLIDKYCLSIDWNNSCFVTWLGDDNIIIQDDTRRDNGVWQGSKLLFDEDLYRNEDDTINIEERNTLIENHMEKTGCFSGVFRVDIYGNVYLVSTLKKGA